MRLAAAASPLAPARTSRTTISLENERRRAAALAERGVMLTSSQIVSNKPGNGFVFHKGIGRAELK